MFLTGIFQALIFAIQAVFFNNFIRIAGLHYDLNGVLFACVCGIAASFVLLMYAGPGRLAIKSIKNWAIWAYGICGVAQFSLDIYLVKYVSATELSLFNRINLIVAIILSFIFLKKKIKKVDFFALTSICIGSLVLFYIQDSAIVKTVAILVFLIALFRAIEFFSSEVFTQFTINSSSGNMRDRARVVGIISFFSCILFLVFCFIISCFKYYFNLNYFILNNIPKPLDYFHLPTIIFALIYGLFITAFVRFCMWSATYKIKTENVLAILIIVPVLTYLSELVIINIFDINKGIDMLSGDRGLFVLLALLFMTVGSLLSIIPKTLKNIDKKERLIDAFREAIKQKDNNYEIQHSAFDSSDYDVLEQTLAFYDNDYQKVSQLYNISEDAIKVVLLAKGNSCFIDEVSTNIQKIYKTEIVLKDKLTGAKNRMALTKDALYKIENQKDFNLVLLDLNDFKPVNDTYGHKAGDFVLKTVVERLNAVYKDCTYRLGGDEFVLLLEKANKQDIISIIEQEIKFEDNTIKISASVGVSSYPFDNQNLQDLLSFADSQVYEDKENKQR